MTSLQNSPAAYLRHPDVRGDLVTFVAADDVWCAPVDGGHAWRLTDDAAPVAYPRLSPDGTRVAFVSHVSGVPEVYVTAADGSGPVRQLTFWGNVRTRVSSWLDDERIVVTTGHGSGHPLRDAVLWAVPLEGHAVRLPFGRGSEVAIHPNGTTVVTTMWRRDPATWKHYQGGTAAKLWVSTQQVALDAPLDEHARRPWRPLLDDVLASKTRGAFHGDRFVFASDTPGPGAAGTDRASGNLWSVLPDGSDLRRHTDFSSETGYLREPATDGHTIVFTSRGRLYAMDDLDAEPRVVDVRTAGVFGARREHPADVESALVAIRPIDERSSVVEWRGSAHTLTHRHGPARLLAGRSGLRIREVHPLPTTAYVLYVTDELAQSDREDGGVGSDALGLMRQDGAGEPVVLPIGDVGRVLHAVPSPDGSKVAVSTSSNTILLVGLNGTGAPEANQAEQITASQPAVEAVTEVGRSSGGEIADITWSPDSRYLVWSEPNSWFRARLMVSDTLASERTGRAVTDGTYRDTSPAFSTDGTYLAFISARTFETMYDDLVFDLSFVNAERPYLIPLDRTTPDPFGPSVEGWGPARSDDEQKAAPGGREPTSEGAPPPQESSPGNPEFDLDAVEARVVPFPVESGHFSTLRAIDGGFAWLRHPAEIVLGNQRAGVEGEAPGPALEAWRFNDHKHVDLADRVSAFEPTPDGQHLVIHKDGKHSEWALIPSAHPVESDDDAHIVIDLGRLRLTIDPIAERRGMLWDNYRLMAQQYWRADMDGQDWHTMVGWYDASVASTVTDDDFHDLLWETVGELGTSHAYVMPTPSHPDPATRPAFLGADIERVGDRWIITTVLPGDSSDPAARSPLHAPGVAADPGDAIVAVDGRAVEPDRGPQPLLIGSAGRPTELVLERDGARRAVVVIPLSDDTQLRYQAWVASRRSFVAQRSGGRLGYLHIPDMVSSGWAQMHRDLRAATAHEGVVVDVRYNSGGHTSQLVTDRLARRVVSWNYPRGETPSTYPEFAPRGPVVLVTNEEAGSDGDIVNAVARAMKIGPVIGRRTWGGVIGIDGRFDLVDGTGVTQPKYASWFEGVDWSIENYGVEPDIDVPFPPNAWVAGEDPQLARGVDEALALLEQHPAATPPPLPPARFGQSG